MPVYFICGTLGSGKTLTAVSKLRDALEAGAPIATNLNLDLAKLTPPKAPAPVVYRLPDFPAGDDLYALGEVDNGGNEDLNGAVVLDEAGLYLNARTWNDRGRARALEWFLHSRKLGWNVYLLTQSFGMVDKQVRESIGEYVVTMRRWDRMLVPIFGRALRAFTLGLYSGKLPQVHTAAVRYGHGPNAMHADTWHIRGRDLYGAYQTKQRFSAHYPHGLFCQLPGTSLVEAPAPARSVDRPRVASPELTTRRASSNGRTLKPKRPEVAAVMGLPPDEAWRRARELAGAGA